jgi:hypothetical protein
MPNGAVYWFKFNPFPTTRRKELIGLRDLEVGPGKDTVKGICSDA